jgi:hypothetical protein
VRIIEIIESELVNPHIQKKDWEPSPFSRDQVDKAGAYSYVDPDDTDDHQVRMRNFRPMIKDNKMEFYKYLAPLMGANPYMPIVYNIDNFLQSNYRSRNEFQMERLVDANDLDPVRLYQALSLVLNHLGNSYEDQYHSMNHARKFMKQYENDPHDNNAKNLMINVHEHLSNMVLKEAFDNYPSLPDSPLKEFYEYLHDFAENNDVLVDMHDENFLYRRTPHGAQMVIADPVDSEPL